MNHMSRRAAFVVCSEFEHSFLNADKAVFAVKQSPSNERPSVGQTFASSMTCVCDRHKISN